MSASAPHCTSTLVASPGVLMPTQPVRDPRTQLVQIARDGAYARDGAHDGRRLQDAGHVLAAATRARYGARARVDRVHERDCELARWRELEAQPGAGRSWDELGVPHVPDEGRTQMHSDALRYTQAHSDALRCTQMHSDALRCTQMHSDALRCTQMHSGAIRCIRRYLPAQAEQQSKPIQVAVVSKQDGALGRARHDAPLKCTEQPVQQRRILRGRALIHVLNRTQVVLPPNPFVQLRQSVTISRNQSQSVDHQWYSPATR